MIRFSKILRSLVLIALAAISVEAQDSLRFEISTAKMAFVGEHSSDFTPFRHQWSLGAAIVLPLDEYVEVIAKASYARFQYDWSLDDVESMSLSSGPAHRYEFSMGLTVMLLPSLPVKPYVQARLGYWKMQFPELTANSVVNGLPVVYKTSPRDEPSAFFAPAFGVAIPIIEPFEIRADAFCSTGEAFYVGFNGSVQFAF